jgi:hypothetical protein
MSKDAVITVRVTRASRRRIEAAARQEGRSLSQLIERLIDKGLGIETAPPVVPRFTSAASRSLAGLLGAGRVPTLADFQTVRAELSSALGRKARR